jgi:hypothetical protein
MCICCIVLRNVRYIVPGVRYKSDILVQLAIEINTSHGDIAIQLAKKHYQPYISWLGATH